MSNKARGEVTLMCEGRALCLCLTLGALAEIETAIGGISGRDGQRLSVHELIAILRALLKGGGDMEAAREVEHMKLDLGEAANAIAAAFAAAGMGAA